MVHTAAFLTLSDQHSPVKAGERFERKNTARTTVEIGSIAGSSGTEAEPNIQHGRRFFLSNPPGQPKPKAEAQPFGGPSRRTSLRRGKESGKTLPNETPNDGYSTTN